MGGALNTVSKAVGTVLSPIGQILGSGNQPTVVQPAEEATMPTEDTEQVTRARRRKTAMQMQRGGRTSTILSGGSDTLGG